MGEKLNTATYTGKKEIEAIKIPVAVVNNVLSYLGRMPYIEVRNLIEEISICGNNKTKIEIK